MYIHMCVSTSITIPLPQIFKFAPVCLCRTKEQALFFHWPHSYSICLRLHDTVCNVNSTSFANGTDVCTRRTSLPCTRRDTNQEPCPTRGSQYKPQYFSTRQIWSSSCCLFYQSGIGWRHWLYLKGSDILHLIMTRIRGGKPGKRGSITGRGTGLHHILQACSFSGSLGLFPRRRSGWGVKMNAHCL